MKHGALQMDLTPPEDVIRGKDRSKQQLCTPKLGPEVLLLSNALSVLDHSASHTCNIGDGTPPCKMAA